MMPEYDPDEIGEAEAPEEAFENDDLLLIYTEIGAMREYLDNEFRIDILNKISIMLSENNSTNLVNQRLSALRDELVAEINKARIEVERSRAQQSFPPRTIIIVLLLLSATVFSLLVAQTMLLTGWRLW